MSRIEHSAVRAEPRDHDRRAAFDGEVELALGEAHGRLDIRLQLLLHPL